MDQFFFLLGMYINIIRNINQLSTTSLFQNKISF